jgi:hypothetical protein
LFGKVYLIRMKQKVMQYLRADTGEKQQVVSAPFEQFQIPADFTTTTTAATTMTTTAKQKISTVSKGWTVMLSFHTLSSPMSLSLSLFYFNIPSLLFSSLSLTHTHLHTHTHTHTSKE